MLLLPLRGDNPGMNNSERLASKYVSPVLVDLVEVDSDPKV